MLQLRAHSITQYQMKEARVCIDATIPLLSHSGLHIYGGDLNTKHLSDGDPSLGRPAESLGRISCPPPPHTHAHTHSSHTFRGVSLEWTDEESTTGAAKHRARDRERERERERDDPPFPPDSPRFCRRC